MFRLKFSIKAHWQKTTLLFPVVIFHARCATLKWKNRNYFSVVQKLTLSQFTFNLTRTSRPKIFVFTLSLSQNNISSDSYPVVFSVSLHCPTKLIKKRRKKKSPCFMKCHLWCYQSLYCAKQDDFMSWRKPMAHKLSRGEWVMIVVQIR